MKSVAIQLYMADFVVITKLQQQKEMEKVLKLMVCFHSKRKIDVYLITQESNSNEEK